jgi:hypothetical protein
LISILLRSFLSSEVVLIALSRAIMVHFISSKFKIQRNSQLPLAVSLDSGLDDYSWTRKKMNEGGGAKHRGCCGNGTS